jgi:putative spermidine/putrescine transport system ATP-binding protein
VSAADVQLEQVSKGFGGVVAVSDVSLDVRPGELLVLLGPSGCGKTTMLRLIAGLEEPTAGIIRIAGQVVNGVPPYDRDTALVFQNWALFPHKTVADNIAFGLRMRRVPAPERRRKVREALDLVRLPEVGERMPGQLSGGQQQRVALARALVVEPRVLLMDEPLSNLDLKLRQQMRVEIKQIQQRLKITTIFVTHDQTEALELADRVAVLNEGRTEQIGSPAELYERPRTRFVADFIGESNVIAGAITAVHPTTATFTTRGGLAIEIRRSADIDAAQTVTLSLRPEQVGIYPPEAKTPENAFQGRICARSYLGVRIRYRVELGEHDRLVVDRPNGPDEPAYAVGEHVTVGWTTDSPRCLPR